MEQILIVENITVQRRIVTGGENLAQKRPLS